MSLQRRDLLLGAALLGCACGTAARDEIEATGISTGSAGSSDSSAATDAGSSMGNDAGSTAGPTGGATTEAATAGSSGGGSATTSTTGDPGGKANGEPCSDDGECMSGNCYLLPMAGFCAACNEDADCPDGGCQADPIAAQAWCTDGGLGTMCQTDEACDPGLLCAELFDAKGFVDVTFCSECAQDADCPAGVLCVPRYADSGLSGYRTCVQAGTVPDDQGCPVDGNGLGVDAACASGICNVVDVGGLGILVGVCGECETSADCGGGICAPATATLENGVKGGVCQ